MLAGPRVFCLAAMLLLVARATHAQPYIAQMPTPDQVAQKIPGDTYEGARQQLAAIHYLKWMMDVMDAAYAPGALWSPAELRLRGSYDSQAIALQRSALIKVHGEEEFAAHFDEYMTQFSGDARRCWEEPAFRELMASFFTAEFQSEFARLSKGVPPGSTYEPRTFNEKVAGAESWNQLVDAVPMPWRRLLRRDTWITVLGVWFALAFLRQLYPLRVLREPKLRMTVAGKRFRIGHISGVVRDVQRWTDHRVVSSTSSFTNANGSTDTVHQDRIVGTSRLQVMLTTHEGTDVDLQFKDENYPVMIGHRVSAMWAIRGKRKSGNYIIYHNHDMKRISYTHALSEMLRPSLKPAFLLPPFLFVARVGWPWILVIVVLYVIVVRIVHKISLRRFQAMKVWQLADIGGSVKA